MGPCCGQVLELLGKESLEPCISLLQQAGHRLSVCAFQRYRIPWKSLGWAGRAAWAGAWQCWGAQLLCPLEAEDMELLHPSSLPTWELGSASNPSTPLLPACPSLCLPVVFLVTFCGPLVPHYPLPACPKDSWTSVRPCPAWLPALSVGATLPPFPEALPPSGPLPEPLAALPACLEAWQGAREPQSVCLTWGINSSGWAKERAVHNQVCGIDSPGQDSVCTSPHACPCLPESLD